MKTKICSKCKQQLPNSMFFKQTVNKDGLARWCKACVAAYNQVYRQTAKSRAAQKKYRQGHKIEAAKLHRKYQQEHKTELAEYERKNRLTIKGRLHSCFSSMRQRCNNPSYKQYKDYGGRGIKNLFKTSDEFIGYVINVLQVDPRGLDIHRPDNDGNYEPGNIIFIPHNEHIRLHRAMQCEKKK